MGQRVVQNQVAGAKQMAESRFVRAMAADEDQGRVGADEFGDRAFQFLMDRLFARDEPAGRDARAEAIDRLLGGLVTRRSPEVPR